MNDAENLCKLLGHLPPRVFHAFLVRKLSISLPDLDDGLGKREQRAVMEDVLSALDVRSRQRIEEVAERIALLSDGPGQDVMDGISQDIFDDQDREAFANLRNQYERALWLYLHEPALFETAMNGRQADVLKQSTSCHSGFLVPKHLSVLEDAQARQAFHREMSKHLNCETSAVAVQVFKRIHPDSQTGEEVELYQISVHHNRPPEFVESVQDSELVPQEVVRAVSMHITYEPSHGFLEVLSKGTDGRESIARMVADLLLQSPITGEKIPIKQYDYQSLAATRTFDISGDNIALVKVTELGYSTANHRSLLVKIWARDADNIYAAARELIAPTFDFRHHRLNYAKLSIRIKKDGKDRARTISVILREDNQCNIKSKREKDRALCDRMLAKWQLVKEIGHAPLNTVAA